jgi:hypothetical protein
MALLLLRGYIAPVHSAAAPALWRQETTGRLRYRRSSRFLPVTSAAAASSPSGDGPNAAVLHGSDGSTAKAHDYGGTNGAVTGTAKSTSIETTVERVSILSKVDSC